MSSATTAVPPQRAESNKGRAEQRPQCESRVNVTHGCHCSQNAPPDLYTPPAPSWAAAANNSATQDSICWGDAEGHNPSSHSSSSTSLADCHLMCDFSFCFFFFWQMKIFLYGHLGMENSFGLSANAPGSGCGLEQAVAETQRATEAEGWQKSRIAVECRSTVASEAKTFRRWCLSYTFYCCVSSPVYHEPTVNFFHLESRVTNARPVLKLTASAPKIRAGKAIWMTKLASLCACSCCLNTFFKLFPVLKIGVSVKGCHSGGKLSHAAIEGKSAKITRIKP